MVDMKYIMNEEKQEQYEDVHEKISKGMKLYVAKRNVECLKECLKSNRKLGLSTKSTKLLIRSYKKEIKQFKKQGIKEVEAYCEPLCHY